MGSSGPGRVRVERGIYRQPNGEYAVCWRNAGRRQRAIASLTVDDVAELRTSYGARGARPRPRRARSRRCRA